MRQPAPPERVQILRRGLDFPRLRGLEIGALDKPVVLKTDGEISYIDYADLPSLRDTHKDNEQVDIGEIVEVDFVWSQSRLADGVAAQSVDYVIASHVAEHVPDLISWLAEIHEVLRPGGQLRLVLPDKRFSFDVLRRETTLVDLLAKWVVKARRPQVQDVLDFRLYFAPSMQGQQLFEGSLDMACVKPIHDFDLAVETAGWAHKLPDVYFDVHCWVFQARTFATLFAELAERGLVRFKCAAFIDTAWPLFEFYVFLEPCDDPAIAAESWRQALLQLQDPLPGSADAQREAERQRAMAWLHDGPARLAAAEQEIAVIRGSTSWKVTSGLRWIGKRIKGNR